MQDIHHGGTKTQRARFFPALRLSMSLVVDSLYSRLLYRRRRKLDDVGMGNKNAPKREKRKPKKAKT
jgi:hypothetical protein